MTRYKISIHNIKNVRRLDVCFDFSRSNIIVLTGRNGVGKTTIVKSFNLIVDPNIFARSSGEDAINPNSRVTIEVDSLPAFSFTYNKKLDALDSTDILPHENTIRSELPIPFGRRFHHFSMIAAVDSELKIRIASSDYKPASFLIQFLSEVYSENRFAALQCTKIKGVTYYFTLKDKDYYLREDHFSSGEYFLIQLYRLVTSGAKLILVDEVDVALDAIAQSNLYSAIKPLLHRYNSRLIVISHSLAFMETVDSGGLYYLENQDNVVTLEPRSYNYIKSDLFGFRGYDRYILTEDEVLEGFIEYLITYFSISSYYQHITIGVSGVNQLRKIVEKNDQANIFSSSENVMCIVDGDVFTELARGYQGNTKLLSSPVDDIELYVYLNRSVLLPSIDPPQRESSDSKRASKRFWKYLTKEKDIRPNKLFQMVLDADRQKTEDLVNEIRAFLSLEST